MTVNSCPYLYLSFIFDITITMSVNTKTRLFHNIEGRTNIMILEVWMRYVKIFLDVFLRNHAIVAEQISVKFGK